jgi:hypothetical protein
VVESVDGDGLMQEGRKLLAGGCEFRCCAKNRIQQSSHNVVLVPATLKPIFGKNACSNHM